MSEPAVDTARPLEVLHLAAKALDAVICLCSTSDGRDSTGKRARSATHIPSRISRLAVVLPDEDRSLDRWRRLQRGELLAVVSIVDRNRPLDWYAEQALAQLAARLRRRAA